MEPGTWQFAWTFIVQPAILIGLFSMTFISMLIAIRGFKKTLKEEEEAINKNKESITHNAQEIKELYAVVKEHLEAGEELKKALSSTGEKDYL
jgi:Sec-independent protein translocase protein TatA